MTGNHAQKEPTVRLLGRTDMQPPATRATEALRIILSPSDKPSIITSSFILPSILEE